MDNLFCDDSYKLASGADHDPAEKEFPVSLLIALLILAAGLLIYWMRIRSIASI